jgi:FtsP/CotA-like multicopper oxidase with cupredoxin domain
VVVHPARGGPAGEARDVVALAHTYSGVQTLNGRTGTQQVPARPGELVRVRLVNTDNGSQTAWTDGPFRLLAVDGFDVHRPTPVSRRSVGIPAGGRVDLAVRVPEDGAARVDLLGDVALVIGPHGAEAAAASQPEEQLDLLDYGSPAVVGFDATRPDRRFDYSIGRRPAFLDGRPGMWWSVNGHTYPDMPMFVVREGDVSVIRISNHSGAVHPMHLHGHHAVVLTRNGHAVRGSPWWFDSLDVADGDTYEVAFLADNPGVWMDHCHNLKHATEGLVTHLMYEGVSTPYLLGEGSGNEPE